MFTALEPYMNKSLYKLYREQALYTKTYKAVWLLSVYSRRAKEAAGRAQNCLGTPNPGSACFDPLESLSLGVKEDSSVLLKGWGG